MSYEAKIYNVMTAGPDDVATERRVARDVILEWNAIHAYDRRLVLMPVGWETHSSPMTGDRPQGIINKQIVETADLLIAIFWTSLGSPTGESPSGTVEEIEKHVGAGKPAMVYFSSAPVHLDSVDDAKYRALKKFRDEQKGKILYETYDGIGEFREKLTRQLAQTVIRNFAADAAQADETDTVVSTRSAPSLSDAAKELLIEVARDQNGRVLKARFLGGMTVNANGKSFVQTGDPRSAAMLEAAIEELCELQLLQERGHKGEVFSITNEGYRMADLLRASG